MDDDNDTRWPACYRCHNSKLRCRRAPNQLACNRCIRAQVECSPRPSRRGQRSLSNSNMAGLITSAQGREARHSASVMQPSRDSSIDSPGSHSLDADMLQAMAMSDVSWQHMMGNGSGGDSDMSMSDHLGSNNNLNNNNSVSYDDFFNFSLDTTTSGTTGTSPQLQHDTTPSTTTAAATTTTTEHTTTEQVDFAMRNAGGVDPLVRPAASDTRVHELSRLNILLVNQQETTAKSILRLRVAFQVSSSPEDTQQQQQLEQQQQCHGVDSLGLAETLRIALQLVAILRQSCPSHDAATALLLLSCYTRLAAIFRDIFTCLEPIFVHSKDQLPRLFPQVTLGSVSIGDGDGDGDFCRLQAEMVLGAADRVFSNISTQMELFIDKDRGTGRDNNNNNTLDDGSERGTGTSPDTSCNSTTATPESNRSSTVTVISSDMLDEGIRIAREERSAVSELVGNLRRALR